MVNRNNNINKNITHYVVYKNDFRYFEFYDEIIINNYLLRVIDRYSIYYENNKIKYIDTKIISSRAKNW